MLFPLVLGALLFRRFVSPGINGALEEVTEAVSKITNVAKLAGVKSTEYRDSKALEQAVSADLIREKLPELEALRMILSPSTWEQIEETLERNPEAVIQLYEKYGHLLPGADEQAKKLEFDF